MSRLASSTCSWAAAVNGTATVWTWARPWLLWRPRAVMGGMVCVFSFVALVGEHQGRGARVVGALEGEQADQGPGDEVHRQEVEEADEHGHLTSSWPGWGSG